MRDGTSTRTVCADCPRGLRVRTIRTAVRVDSPRCYPRGLTADCLRGQSARIIRENNPRGQVLTGVPNERLQSPDLTAAGQLSRYRTHGASYCWISQRQSFAGVGNIALVRTRMHV